MSDIPFGRDGDGEGEQDTGPTARQRVWAALTSGIVRQTVGTLLVLAVAGGVLWLSWQLAGPIATILYAILFVFTLTLVPFTLTIMGKSTPFGNSLGKGEFILAQFAYGCGVLVEREHKWDYCKGVKRDGEYYIRMDGDLYGPVGAEENLTILGWMPFGIVKLKDDETWEEYRVDGEVLSAREQEVADDLDMTAYADGGSEAARGGYSRISPRRHDGLDEDAYLLDLKSVYRGLQQIGDTSLLEKEEEVAQREEVAKTTADKYGAFIGTFVGLVIGVATGLLFFGL